VCQAEIFNHSCRRIYTKKLKRQGTYIVSGEPLFGISPEDPLKQTQYLLVCLLGWQRLELARLNASEQVSLELAVKRQFSNVDRVKNHAGSPHIGREGVVGRFASQIRAHVVGCAADSA
jgi:hypothetical protein